ncbi:MAG: hypothetical protein J5790_00900 [Bacteroidaceae bacterium]|nr:hypothetical protein [Bacteroidaceae bacterium]
MKTKKLFWVALTMMCTLTLHMNGQSANETKQQQRERLEKAADNDPTDWQKQIEAAHFLLDKDGGIYDQVGAMKYYERIYHMVADVNRVVPDSIFQETSIALMFTAMNLQDMENAMFYGDELKRYAQVTKNKESTGPIMVNTMATLLKMGTGQVLEAASRLKEVRDELSRREIQGLEYTDMMMMTLYEQVMSEFREFMEDKLIEVTIDGKTYVLIAIGDWNIEMPFVNWMPESKDVTKLFIDENGHITDDLHGEILFKFNWSEKDKAILKSEDTNSRLVTITPERRQQMIEAYRNYMKKKSKK